MSILEPVELPKPKFGPELLVGAASPLWGYFTVAAIGGLTYWWMTQWARPVNLEAMFGMDAAALPKAEEVEAAVSKMDKLIEEAAAPALLAVETAVEESPPVGGEAAPITPAAPLEAAIETPLKVAEAVTEALTAPLETLPTARSEPASFQAEPSEPELPAVAAKPPGRPASGPKPKKSAGPTPSADA